MTSLIVHDEPAMPVWTGRVVLTHGAGNEDGHETATHRTVAARLAALLDLPFAGGCEEERPFVSSYLVPRSPLSGRRIASKLAIRSEDDLFGSWVPHAWMATKAIMHPLASADASTPAGWLRLLARKAEPLTLRGMTAFSAPDALAAGQTLLRAGPVRLKPANADGGRGQIVARTQAEIESAIASLCADGRLADILTLEENLEEVVTYSVGQVRLRDRTISYCGTQSTTANNEGADAYGGSVLLVVPGGFDRLLVRTLPTEMREAISRAVAFDALADRYVPGLIASRRNYDVACGVAPDGSRRVGVLEQSWRMGGATGAEIAALEVFGREPLVSAVHAATVEVYGDAPALPDDATVYYQGRDPVVGPLTKYACVEKKVEG